MAENKKILRALAGEVLETPPIWMMRQAGRYLPEYRATRAEAGDFLSLCYNSELAAEVTLQPIRRYGFDAAILFADISWRSPRGFLTTHKCRQRGPEAVL